MTKTLEQFKRQLKTHIFSFLASHQDMINSYGNYSYRNNFPEKDVRKFILVCQKLVKDPDVNIYYNILIAIINKDYQSLFKLLYQYSKQKSCRNGS